MAAQHRVLVPEYQQLSIFRPVAAEHQDGQAEQPANQQVDDLEQHPASQPSPPQACCRQRRSAIKSSIRAAQRPCWLIPRGHEARASSRRARWLVRVRSSGWPFHQACSRIKLSATAALACSRRGLARPRERAWRMPVTATPWRMVPSTPARKAYLAWKSLASWAARAAIWASWTCRRWTVSWRRPAAEVVHWARTGQGRQVLLAKVITIVSVPRWVTGFQELLAWPCGQVACWASKSMAKAV